MFLFSREGTGPTYLPKYENVGRHVHVDTYHAVAKVYVEI